MRLSHLRLKDGEQVLFRHISPDDKGRLAGALALRQELAGRTVAFPVTGSNV